MTCYDGDLGVAYTSNGLNVQAALPNVRNFLKDETTNTADWAIFYTSVSYKIDVNNDDAPLNPKSGLPPQLYFKEDAGFWRIFFIGTLILSIIGLKMVTPNSEDDKTAAKTEAVS